jgi:hypothetical protein
VGEIKKVARRDPVLAAEGAVLFLERVSPALEHVDSSSGAIGTAVNHAIEELVAIIARAPADAKTARAGSSASGTLTRATRSRTSSDSGTSGASSAYRGKSPRRGPMGWSASWRWRGARIRSCADSSTGTTACFSALLRAGRHEKILALLEKAPFVFWPYRQWGVRALAALGRTDEATRYAEASRGQSALKPPFYPRRQLFEFTPATGRVDSVT